MLARVPCIINERCEQAGSKWEDGRLMMEGGTVRINGSCILRIKVKQC